ncbi:hypothetical protein E1263_27105 [Kribbella antibiotica]|uniref:Uncharacterized protein n=1 Tax=Kribbella antibiotica TaxID=190195 RepID=A0A4R4Z899_9ACTN|nr:hypothetical protein [Kribbella antibiotica]TDD54511.1 hypothetical protein E1263_27105 [Kribbella antibiotica]
MSDEAQREAFEHEIRTALFQPAGEFRQRQFRMMLFTTATALLALLAPTWYVVTSNDPMPHLVDTHSGISLFAGAGDAITGGPLGPVPVLVYILLAVTLMLVRAATVTGILASLAGAVMTIVIVVNRPESKGTTEVEWTGALVVVIALWLLSAAICGTASSAARR